MLAKTNGPFQDILQLWDQQ